MKRSAFVYTQITCFAYRAVDITHRNDSMEPSVKTDAVLMHSARSAGCSVFWYSGLIYPKDRTRFYASRREADQK